MICSEISRSAAITLKSWLPSSKLFHFRKFDTFLAAVVLFLLCVGAVMVYSSSFIYAQEKFGDGYVFIRRHLIFSGLGLLALLFAASFDPNKWMKWSYPFLLFCTFLLVLVFLPGTGARMGGANRWIDLGFLRFQPAELTKLAIVIFVCRQLQVKWERLESFSAGVLANFFVPFPALLLLLFQPDFGSIVLVCTTVFTLMFLSRVPIRYFVFSGGIAVALLALVAVQSPYRFARILTFLDPWSDPTGRGFQIVQSLIGFQNGGFFGAGLGNGKEKLFFLPEAHNDFIFSVIGEELGFIGVAILIVTYILFSYRGFKIAFRALKSQKDYFLFLLAAGVTTLISLQAFVNMGVVMGLLPTKGLTLPFISYGGSALITTLFSVGILMSISRYVAESKGV